MSRLSPVTSRPPRTAGHGDARSPSTPISGTGSVADFVSHARYGHRLAQISVSQPPVPRDAADEEELQRKAEGAPAPRPNVPVAVGGGAALSAPVRGKMERSFGHSFADVRIHSGGEAGQVGALAYTRGTDIHFQPGLYDSDSLGGQELLGHELTHVVQQRAGRVSSRQHRPEGVAPINADTGLESEADVMGARAARGQKAPVSNASDGGLQRKALDTPIQRQDTTAQAALPPPLPPSALLGLPPLLPPSASLSLPPLPPSNSLPLPPATTALPAFPSVPSAPPSLSVPPPLIVPPPLVTPLSASASAATAAPVAAPPSLITPPLATPPTASTVPAAVPAPATAPAAAPAPATAPAAAPAPAETSRWYMPGRKYEAASNILNTDLSNQASTSAEAVQHSSLADLNAGGLMSDSAAAGINVASVLGLPGNVVGGMRGAKNLYGGLKSGGEGRDWHRAFEGASELSGNIIQAGNTGLNVASGVGSLSNALSISAAATAPVGLATSAMMTAKSLYQTGMAQHHSSALGAMDIDPADQALADARDHAQATQGKRRNRAILNTTANGLMVAGAATTIGTGYTGVGAGVGAGLAASGAGLKAGAWGFRKLKQSSRDSAARREEEKGNLQPDEKLGLWDRTIGRASDAVFNPNTEKTTDKKDQKYNEHTATILGNPTEGREIFSHLGANKSDLKMFDDYHAGQTDLAPSLQARIKEQFKYRGE